MRNVLLVLFCKASCILAWIAAGQLFILRGSNLNHPHTLQSSWSTALLAPAPPPVFHLKPLPHFTDFLGNCAGNLVCHRSEKPPWPLLAPLFWNSKNSKILGQILKNNCILLDTIRQNLVSLAFFGAESAAFCVVRQFCGGRGHTYGFCLEKSTFWLRKSQKKADFGRKPYVNISGFLRQFCGRFSKVKIHLPMVRIAFFSVLSAHPRSCRPFPP